MQKLVPLLLALPLALPAAAEERKPAGKAPVGPASRRAVFVAGGLGAEEVVQLSAWLAADRRGPLLLLDSPKAARANADFLKQYAPAALVAVGNFPEGREALRERLGRGPDEFHEWKGGPPESLRRALFPKAGRAVVCPAGSTRLLWRSACLAGASRCPLVLLRGGPGEEADLGRRLEGWGVGEVVAVGGAAETCREAGDFKVKGLRDERAVEKAHLGVLAESGPVEALVVANPADWKVGGMTASALAPWVALHRRAALVLTGADGEDVEGAVKEALKDDRVGRAEFLILVGGHGALPTKTRPNPAPGLDVTIEMEPLTPEGKEPFSFATGRLFHEDPAVVAATLARQHLPARDPKALMVSNEGGGLPLLEILSRHTALELANAGYDTTALFTKASPEKVRALLPAQDVFIWEGHYRTLIDEYRFLEWDEPLRPSLVFLQSCLALNESEVGPLFSRGAVGVVGASTRIYSATGGAYSLAYFDALLYDRQTLGGSLRQAKNFLLAYTLLKEERLGEGARLSGANLRSAWAFSLWGDPTHRLPLPAPPEDARPHVRHKVEGGRITVMIPGEKYRTVRVGNYYSRMPANARLAGLVARKKGGDERRLIPLIFEEIHLPDAPEGRTPRLKTELPEDHWVFLWDARLRRGYLLIRPEKRAGHELRFEVEWPAETKAGG